MGDAQSAQREGKEDGAVDEEVVELNGAQNEEITEDKPLQNNKQISGLDEKVDEPMAEADDQFVDIDVEEVCELSDTIVPLEVEEAPEAMDLLKEEAPLESVDINEKESPDADEAAPSETEAKLNEINEGFKKFFSNIGLKLTVKKDSDSPAEVKEGEPSKTDDIEDAAKETTSDDAGQNVDLNTAQGTPDNDSTTCPTMTDLTPEDTRENTEEKDRKMTEEVTPDIVVEALSSITVGEEEMTAEEDAAPGTTSLTSSGEEGEAVSPIKKFFTTGLFSGLRKKKKNSEQETKDDANEKELVDMRKHEDATMPEEAEKDQEQMTEDISPGVKTTAGKGEQEASEVNVEITLTTSGAAGTTEVPGEGPSAPERPSSAVVSEAEILSSQERVKVQGSPLKRLLSGSSFKKLSKKQSTRRASDPKLTDSGEHSDQLLSSTESAEGTVHSPEELTQQEDGTWASLKKLVTRKKRPKRSSQSDEETVISSPISDRSTEETKKKIDSSGTWEALLSCGSGKKKAGKTSDSEDEAPGDPKHGAGSPLESSHEEDERLASSPERTGSPLDGDGVSTWKSLKRLVTPKRKAKDEEESRDHVTSDTESNKDESSFSIKNLLLPGCKKRKPADKQDLTSSDEVGREVGSGDEDSETPAVVPLSEFDTAETEAHIQTQAVIESHIPPKVEEAETQKDQVSQQITEAVIPTESPPAEPEKVEDTLKELALPAVPTSDEDFEDLTDLLSKHQQLSDIPEEGIIEESIATPGSIAEEAAIDDTIGDDFIELTSDAVTALEPVDATLADETTEMVSAVSHLTESSSKTSGNTTPVPAEYDEKETEALLHMVCETILVTPNAAAVCAEDAGQERIAGSVSHQICKRSTLEQEATILAAHNKSDAIALSIGLDAIEFDAIKKDTAITNVESASEAFHQIVETSAHKVATIREGRRTSYATALSTGLDTEEFDGIEEVAATSNVESASEVSEAISTELVSEDTTEEFETAQIATDEVFQAQVSEALASAGEVHTLEVANDLQALSAVHVAASNSEEGAQVLEKQVISEDLPAPDADNAIASVTDEPVQRAHVTEVNVEGKEEDELPTVEAVAAGVEHAPAREVIAGGLKDVTADVGTDVQPCTAVPVVTPDVEEGSDEALEKSAIQEDIPLSEDTAGTSVSAEHTEETSLTDASASVSAEHTEETSLTDAGTSVSAEHTEEASLTDASVSVSVEHTEETSLTDASASVSVEHTEETSLTDASVSVSVEHTEETSLTDVSAFVSVVDEHVEDSSARNIPAPDLDTISDSVTALDEHVQDSSLENEALAQTDQAPEVTEEKRTIENEGSVEAPEKQEVPADIPAPDLDTISDSVIALDEHVQDSSLDNEALAQTDQAPEVTEEERTIENDTDKDPQLIEATSSLEEGSVQALEKQEVPTDIPAPDLDTISDSVIALDEHVQDSSLENEALAQTDQVPEVTEEERTIENEGSVEAPEKQEVPTDIPAPGPDTESDSLTVTDEHVQDSSLDNEALVQTDQAPEVTEEKRTIENEGSVEAPEKQEVPADIPAPDLDTISDSVTALDEHVQDSSLKNEALMQTDQAPEVTEEERTVENDTDDVPQHGEVTSSLEEVSVQALEKQEVPTDIPAPGPDTESDSLTVTDEHVQDSSLENEALAQTDQAPEVTEEERTIENEGSVEAPEKQEVPADIPAPDLDIASDSVTALDEHVQDSSLDNEALPQTDQAPEVTEEERTIENDTNEVPQHGEVADEDKTAEVVNELEVLTAVHVAAVNSKAGSVQLLEEKVISEKVPEPDTDTAGISVTEEHILEVHLTEVGVEGEKEAEFPGIPEPDTDTAGISVTEEHMLEVHLTEVSVEAEKEAEFPGIRMTAAEVEFAPMGQVIDSNVTGITASTPDASVVQASDVAEPLVSVVAMTELEATKALESLSALPPFMDDDMTKTAVAGSVDAMQHVPSVLSGGGHEIQAVNINNVAITSAETIVETMLEVGVTDATQVIDVCDETDNEVENLSASLGIEEEITDQANKVITQVDAPCEKENLLEGLQEPMAAEAESCVENEHVILEHKSVMLLPVVILQSCELAGGELCEVEEVQEESCETLGANVHVEPELGQSEDIATPDDPKMDISIHLEEAKVELRKASEVIMDQSQVLVLEKLEEDVEEQVTEITSYQVMESCNTGLDTGMVSSVGDVESPSSLSLEVELNIHFGQTVTGTSPIERGETLTQTDMTNAEVQVTEGEQLITQIQIHEKAEILKQPEPSDTGIRAIEVVESFGRTATIETAETAEEHAIEVHVCAQATETAEPVTKTEEIEIVEAVKQPELSEDGIQATEPVGQIETSDRVEMPEQPEPFEVCGQTIETIEQVTEKEQSITQITVHEKPEIPKQLELTDTGVQMTELVESFTKTVTIERAENAEEPVIEVHVDVQATETAGPVGQTEETEIVETSKQPELSEDGIQATDADRDGVETSKQPELSEDGIQASETDRDGVETSKQPELSEDGIQASETDRDRVETSKQPELSEDGIQASETDRDRVKRPEQPEPSDVWVQAMETIEPAKQMEIGHIEKPVVLNQPMQTELMMTIQQAKQTKTALPVLEKAVGLNEPSQTEEMVATQQVKQTEMSLLVIEKSAVLSQSVQTEVMVATQQVQQTDMGLTVTEKSVVLNEPVPTTVMAAIQEVKPTQKGLPAVKKPLVLNQPVQAEVFFQETETVESVQPLKRAEEETDQDEWQDAEENISTQEGIEKLQTIAVEPAESQKEDYQPDKGAVEHEAAHLSQVDGEGETRRVEGDGETRRVAPGEASITCESEDFVVALPEIQYAAEKTTIGWE